MLPIKRFIDLSWLRTLIRTKAYKRGVIIANWHGGSVAPRRRFKLREI